MGASQGEDGVFGSNDYFVMNTPPSASSIPWVDGYHGQEDVVIEDFAGEIYFRTLLRMLDHYPSLMQIKGSFVQWAPKRIWISSNKHPRDWYPTEGYEGGPLERRLESYSTGHIYNKSVPWT